MKNKLNLVACPLCGSSSQSDFDVLYPARLTSRDLSVEVFSARRLPDKIHYQLVKCHHDGLVRSTPVMPPQKLAELYRRSVLTYNQEIPHLVTTYLRALQPALKQLPKAADILEIGCGDGFVLSALRKAGFKNLFGVEPSHHAIKQAPRWLQSRIEPHLFSAKLFPKQRFDFIFILQTLDHTPDPNAFLKDCAKVLKPGGLILSFHHNVESFSARLLGERHPIFDVEHTFLYSFKTTQAIFEKNGLPIEQIWSPTNTLSWRHLFFLLPIPKKLKEWLLNSNQPLLNQIKQATMRWYLGNICVIGRKPFKS
jgi:2-polyprenyl-3-methyl-5-hydroxy-6-metoxy-1,4-benzoquinol methylase